MESEIKLKLQRVVYVSHSVYWYGILLGGTGGLAWPAECGCDWPKVLPFRRPERSGMIRVL